MGPLIIVSCKQGSRNIFLPHRQGCLQLAQGLSEARKAPRCPGRQPGIERSRERSQNPTQPTGELLNWCKRKGKYDIGLKSCFPAFCVCPHLAARGLWNSTSRCFPSSCHSLLAQPLLLFPDPVLYSRQYFVLFLVWPSWSLIRVYEALPTTCESAGLCYSPAELKNLP